MFKHLGRMLWSQSREIDVLNFNRAMVYQIYTTNGYLYVTVDKTTGLAQVEKRDSINIALYEPSTVSPVQLALQLEKRRRQLALRCCGKTCDVSLDIDATVPTPPGVAPPAAAVVQVSAPPEALVLRQPPAASEPSSVKT